MVDATRPRVVLNGQDLQDIQPHVTPEELRDQFAPTAATHRRMVKAHKQRVQLQRARRAGYVPPKEDDEEKDMFFPIYADREGSFQADIAFMPEDQVFGGFQGIVCLISTNRKIAWCEPYRANKSPNGVRKRQIPAGKMYELLAKCINEIERRFHIKVLQIESDDESMFKGDCRKALQQRGISQYFVQPSISGPFKTKLGVVERFNRTIKLYLNKLMVGYNTRDWAKLLPEALYYYNFQHKNRAIGQRPAQIDDEEEAHIASQKEQETEETKQHYDNKYLNQEDPRARVARAVENGRPEESKDAFKKERPNWSRVAFHITPKSTGPALFVRHPDEEAPKKRQFLPYNLKWT